MFLTEKAKEARRKYAREWRKNNPDKVKEHTERYWTKKAALQNNVKNNQEKTC